MALTWRWTRNFGKAFGPWKFQKNIKIYCGVRVGTHFQLSKTWRTILQNSSYDRCSLQAEDTLHSLWSYTGLNEVWECDRWNFRSRIHFADFKELCSWILENGKPMHLFAIQVWTIWNQRNKLRLNHSCCLTKELQKMAEDS